MPILLLLLACAAKAPPAPQAPEDAASIEVSEDTPALTTPPFTPEQIRDGMPVGATYRFAIETEGMRLETEWEVLSADEGGCEIRYVNFDPEGAVVRTQEARSAWSELASHAAFPAEAAAFSEQALTTALGTYEVVTVVVTPWDSDPEVTRTFHFAKELPGAPILMTERRGEAETLRFEMLERALR